MSFSFRPESRAGAGAMTAGFAVLLFAVLLVSLSVGKYHVPVGNVFRILVSAVFPSLFPDPAWSELDSSIILAVRLPRAAAAMFVGGALAASGAVFQGIFRNPLASPYTLGVSNGAGFGAALAIMWAGTTLAVQGSAMLFAFAAVFLALKFGERARNSTVTLILAGVVVGSLFAALISLLKFLADPFDKLPAIVFWLMGSLASVNNGALIASIPVFIAGFALLLLYAWRLNILCIGDAEARSYGVDVSRDRTIVIACCSVLAAVSVGMAGVIGWVGLVIPHLSRCFTGPDFRRLLPVSILLGAAYLLAIDDICRTLSAAEIPLGVVTALLGTPVFAWFMVKEKVNW